MRMNRVIAGVVGGALLGLSPVALAPTAGAATTETTVVAVPSAAPAAGAVAKDKIERQITARKVVRRGKTFVVGRLTPDGGRKKVYVKRALSAKAPFRNYTVARTDGKGRFTFRVTFPPRGRAWYYKVTVPGNAKYKRVTVFYKATTT